MGVFSQTLLLPGCSSTSASPSLKMSDRKAVIKNADMSEEMQQDAVDCATQALKNTISKKILPPTSKRNSTKNTTQLGIVSSDVISGPMSLMKPGTLFTSIWVKWPSFYSRAAREKRLKQQFDLSKSDLYTI